MRQRHHNGDLAVENRIGRRRLRRLGPQLVEQVDAGGDGRDEVRRTGQREDRTPADSHRRTVDADVTDARPAQHVRDGDRSG